MLGIGKAEVIMVITARPRGFLKLSRQTTQNRVVWPMLGCCPMRRGPVGCAKPLAVLRWGEGSSNGENSGIQGPGKQNRL